MAEPIGERMTRVETKLGNIEHQLARHDDATAALSTKLDAVLANQAKAETISTQLRIDIEAMQPHINTVADFKKFTTFGRLVIGIGAATIGAMAYAKGWLIFNWQWFTGK